MSYQIADLNNGPFGDTYATIEEAEKALAIQIKEGQKINEAETPEGHEAPNASDFFFIVDAETGEEI